MKFTESSRVSASEAGPIRLADLEIDLLKRTVHRAGRKLPVKGRSFQMLQFLMERHPETAGHGELMAEVWKGVVVSPDALSQRVKLLRKALGRAPDGEEYIVSVHGQGYRLSEPPRPLGSIAQAASPRLRPSKATIFGAIALAACALLLISIRYDLTHMIKHVIKHHLG